MAKLLGKIALITGGNSGIGLATAKLFAAEGAKVIITGRRQKELDQATRSIGNAAIGVQGDVSKMADLSNLYEVIKSEFGHLDIVFANAGCGEVATFESVSEDFYDRHFANNVKGLFFTAQKALPLLRDGSSVILNSSIAESTGYEALSVYTQQIVARSPRSGEGLAGACEPLMPPSTSLRPALDATHSSPFDFRTV
jgi:NAD(P)-dependent dehydrogenase (short-subunit alcohol dehydrogenase family)